MCRGVTSPATGRILNTADHVLLSTLLGNLYGGDGVTTFAIPDLRGRVAIGVGNGITQGAKGGEETHTVTAAELAVHTHTPLCQDAAGNQRGVAGAVWAADSAKLNPPYRNGAPNAQMNAQSIASSGGGQAHENMQPYLVLTWIIAYEGIYPI